MPESSVPRRLSGRWIQLFPVAAFLLGLTINSFVGWMNNAVSTEVRETTVTGILARLSSVETGLDDTERSSATYLSRMLVFEEQLRQLREDVSEIKRDIKAIVVEQRRP